MKIYRGLKSPNSPYLLTGVFALLCVPHQLLLLLLSHTNVVAETGLKQRLPLFRGTSVLLFGLRSPFSRISGSISTTNQPIKRRYCRLCAHCFVGQEPIRASSFRHCHIMSFFTPLIFPNQMGVRRFDNALFHENKKK